MPGVNRTGQPTSGNVWLGRGVVQFAPIDTATGKPTHFRHLGNVTALTMNIDSQTLEHTSSRTGVAQVDREIVLSQKLTVGITLDHTTDFDNLALFFSGAALKDQANAARSATVTDRLIHADATRGRDYELTSAAGVRLFDLSSNTAHLVVKHHATTLGSATALTEGTDYTVDRVWGTIHMLASASNFVDGNSLWFTYTSQSSEQLIDVVNLLTTNKLSGFLRYKGINPANADKKILVDLHSVSLKAEGDVNWIGEEFSELVLSGIAERNELGYPTSPVGRIIYHADA